MLLLPSSTAAQPPSGLAFVHASSMEVYTMRIMYGVE